MTYNPIDDAIDEMTWMDREREYVVTCHDCGGTMISNDEECTLCADCKKYRNGSISNTDSEPVR